MQYTLLFINFCPGSKKSRLQLHYCVAISQVCLAQTYTRDRILVPLLVHTYHIIISFQKCILPIYLGSQRESFLPLVRFYSSSSHSVLHALSASYTYPLHSACFPIIKICLLDTPWRIRSDSEFCNPHNSSTALARQPW